MLPAILTILFLSGFFLPMTTVLIAILTIVLKFISLVTILASKEGYEQCSAPVLKITTILMSDIPVFTLGFVAFGFMISTISD